jgi:hypothetical protein
MSKLNPDKTSKIRSVENPLNQDTSSKIPDKIMKQKKSRVHTFSFKKKDKERLAEILESIQDIMEKKITATDILRGLLIIGKETPSEELIRNINKSFLE